MSFNNYFYKAQLRTYLLQFMSIFAGMQVEIGKNDEHDISLIPVPIQYGSKDRVTASVLAGNTQNKPVRLPVMSAYMTGIELAPDRRKGIGSVRRETFLQRGEMIPDGVKTVRQYMPIPYWINAELGIYASNSLQQHQILEQILMLFDPIVQIQKNDSAFDWTKITMVELMGVRLEENYPMGTDRRMIRTFLDFKFCAYIAPPADLKSDFVKTVFARIGTVDLMTKNPYEVIAALDAMGIEYEELFSTDDLILPQFPVEEEEEVENVTVPGPGVPPQESSFFVTDENGNLLVDEQGNFITFG